MPKTVTGKLLRDVDEFFSDLSIPYFITGGICLSIIRSGTFRDLLYADNQDLDLSILKEDLSPNFKKKFGDAGWTGRYGKLGCELGRQGDLTFYAFKKDGNVTCVIDGNILSKYQNYRWNICASQYRLYDAYLFETPKRVTVEDTTVSLPNPPEEYLKQEYGDWHKRSGLPWQKYPSVHRALKFDLHSKLKAINQQAFKNKYDPLPC